MKQYIIRRILLAIPILIGISIITFSVSRLAPGDPFSHLMNPRIPLELQSQRREQLGLNKPIHIQYFIWLKEILTGNLGYSIRTKEPVAEMLRRRIPATLLLSVTSTVLALALAIPIGVYSAVKQYSPQDYVITVLAFIGVSIPAFFLALLFMYIFGLKLRWLPVAGMMTAGAPFSIVDMLRHSILPIGVLTLTGVAGEVRYTRSAMLEVIRQDYIRTARAKGLQEKLVIYKHALRNALIPIVTLVGLSVPALLSGAILTETVFSWPGMGRLGYDAVLQRDYPVLMAVTLLAGTMVVMGSLLADILYAWVDPRIRYD